MEGNRPARTRQTCEVVVARISLGKSLREDAECHREPPRRKHQLSFPQVDSRRGHVEELRALLVLRHCQPATLFHRACAVRTIAEHSAQYNADSAAAEYLGHAFEQRIGS